MAGGALTRRGFVAVAAGSVAALAGTRPNRAAGATPAPPPFHSRPDLQPPRVAVQTLGAPADAGPLFAAPFDGPGQLGPLIVDTTGEPVWFHPTTAGTAHNFRVQSLAGRPVLTWWEGRVAGTGMWEGDCVIADQSYRTVARLTGANGLRPEIHEFLITSRDTALISSNNLVAADLSPYGGPVAGQIVESVFQEVDVASGRVLLEWHSLDHADPSESALPAAAIWDYFHLNSIGVDEDGNLLISARYPSTVYKLDRSTGAVVWRLGGSRSDFALGDGARFAFQHDARAHPGGQVSVFDDGAYSPETAIETASRAIFLGLDTDAMTAELVAELRNPRGALTTAMGNAQRLGTGGTVVGWGTTPEVSEFGPDGSLALDASFVDGHSTYRAFRDRWVGRPETAPDLAAVRNANGSADVYVSWNGATEVASWQLWGGDAPTALTPRRTEPRAGFETRVRLTAPPTFVSARALDAAGAELGRSAPLRVAV